MQNVISVARVALATLSAVELASVLSRLRHREARREAGWLAAILAAFSARLLAPRGSIGDVLVPLAVIVFAVNLLFVMNRRRGALPWSAAAAGLAAALLALDIGGLAPRALPGIHAAALALLSIPPLVLLVILQRKTGEPADLLLLAMAASWDVACCAEAAGMAAVGVSDWLAAPLLLLIGFMLFEQGYLSPLTTSGYVDRLAAERRLMRRTYARLLESRNAMVLQDRLIAAGLLALGAAHEFKDVLSAVRLAAEHGRSAAEAAHKDRCLELVAEHAAAGAESAAEFLERLGREGREEPAALPVLELIERLVRIARPSWRAAGIVLTVESAGELRVVGRRQEIEQVLLNVLRNAVEAIEIADCALREIQIQARRRVEVVEIAVSDTAGGVAPGKVADLFAFGRSGTGSTGIGLYLARDLALRNEGSLAYRPLPSGSCFTLSLPAI